MHVCSMFLIVDIYPAEMNLLNPEFEVVASSPLALESHPFELICITHNFYPDKISWIRDSVPIDVGSGMGLTLSGSALIFDSLEVGASGNYCCQLPNGGVGQVLERCAQLSVVGEFSLNHCILLYSMTISLLMRP